MENLKMDLLRRVKMLELALQQERYRELFNVRQNKPKSDTPQDTPLSKTDTGSLDSLLSPDPSTFNKKSRDVLLKYAQCHSF